MGYKIVLTADRTLMSDYNQNEFLGFAACSPSFLPVWLFETIFCPSIEEKNGIVEFAPGGIRKLEASLLENGFSEEDVVVAHPDHLEKVVGKDTKILGISTKDPLGLGPASTTFSDLTGKEPYSAISFRKLIFNPLIRKYNLRVIVGGPGAWQLEDERIMAKFGIDCLLVGEGEITAPEVFEEMLNGGEKRIVKGEVVPLEKIPVIRNPTINGIVEIARGCGRGCKFCNPTMLSFRCQPLEKILKEAEINAETANRVLLHAEDVLRYGAKGFIPDEEKVVRLFTEVSKLTENVGISHFSFSSVFSKPELIEKLSQILDAGNKKRWISGQVGIETGSPDLVRRHLKGKVKPFKPEEWREVVIEAHKILKDNNWIPCSTLIMGLPGETPDDVLKTIELIESLKEYKSLIVPLFFVPIGVLDREKFFRMKDMLPEHWQLWAACLKHDFKWVYSLEEEHFEMTGVNGWKRATIKFFTRFMEKKLKPYISMMEEGTNPYTSFISAGG
ncbi:MAG: B12-binding domain-containing radical SAM protein [Candidatus Syntropharchaeia archaeon]